MATCTNVPRMFVYTFIFLAGLRTGFAAWNTKDYLKREHSLIKPYHGSLWDYIGSTMVTNSFVRLTPDHQSKVGGLWNSVPLTVPDWELHVHFKVHGHGQDMFGDGMAVWYTKDRMQSGDVFGSKNGFSGLGIFLDTYSNHNGPHNHQHPYISAMLSNGSLVYDHDRDGTHTQLAGCESQFRNVDHDTLIAVRYTASSRRLRVSSDVDGKGTWKECFTVEGINLPTAYHLGASAATGDLADNHDIISMKLYELEPEEELDKNVNRMLIIPSAVQFDPPREHVDDPKPGFISGRMSGLKLLVIIVLAVIGLGVCGMVGFLIYTNRQDYRRKRFY